MPTDQLQDILFIDIETAPGAAEFEDMPPRLQEHWVHKTQFMKAGDGEDATPARLFSDKAAIFAEFGKVVCIGLGTLKQKPEGWKMYLKSIADTDEKSLLNNFCEVLSTFAKTARSIIFCGHNIKEFDIPFLSRRMVIHGMNLPDCLQHQGKKPWQVPHIDTMDLWAFGDKKSYTKLDLLAAVLDIATPKDDINGAQVGEVFWKEGNLKRISDYCLKDVLVTSKVYMRLAGVTDVAFEAVNLDEKQIA